MRLAAAVVVAGGALAAAAAAAPAGDDPPPTRDCSTRTEPTRGHLRFATPGDVVIGPISFSGLATGSSRRSIGGRRPDGTFLRKSAVKVLWGPPVVVRVVNSDRAAVALEYTIRAGRWQQTAAVRFEQCPPGTRMWNGLRYLRVTGFNGGFALKARGCYTLEVQAGSRNYRRTMSLGAGACE
jgi:hypothetical protein